MNIYVILYVISISILLYLCIYKLYKSVEKFETNDNNKEQLRSVLQKIFEEPNTNIIKSVIVNIKKKDVNEQLITLKTMNEIFREISEEEQVKVKEILDPIIRLYNDDSKVDLNCITNLSLCEIKMTESTCGNMLEKIQNLMKLNKDAEKYKTFYDDIKSLVDDVE